jgi:predicted secreted protein
VNKIKKGTKFRVNLEEDHRTGGTWRLNPDFNHNLIIQISEVWHGNEKGIDFNLQAASPGQTSLSFVKRKYTDTMSYKTFVVEITDN